MGAGTRRFESYRLDQPVSGGVVQLEERQTLNLEVAGSIPASPTSYFPEGIMGYLKIPNLYKDNRILEFKEVYALEKIHGTSAHISWKEGTVCFFSGGAKHETFVSLFSVDQLKERFQEFFGETPVVVYGEAYGGKIQKMAHTYGPEMKFIAFDVTVDGKWLDVVNAEQVVHEKLGLMFVPYSRVKADIEVLNKYRDAPSLVARWAVGSRDKPREGIVLRPTFEVTLNNGSRLIAKHKALEFQETSTPREVDPEKLKVLTEAREIAEEWVTPMRLRHVVDKLPFEVVDMTRTKDVVVAMIEDVYTEGEGELVESKDTSREIGKKTAFLLRRYLQENLERT